MKKTSKFFGMASAKKLVVFAIGLSMAASASSHAQLVPLINFETAGDFSNNFRVSGTPAGTFGQTSTTDVGEPNNDYVFNSDNAADGTPLIAIYDTTPGNAGDTTQTFAGEITVKFDISTANSNSSFGVYLFDPSNLGNNLLVLANILSTTSDRFRLRADASMTTGTIGADLSDTTLNTGLNDSPEATPVFGELTLVYTPGATSDVLTFTVGAAEEIFTITQASGNRLGVNPGIAFRLNDTVNDANTTKLDNFQIVPEPSSAILLALGGMLLVRRHRQA